MEAILDGQGKCANRIKFIIMIAIVLVTPPARRGPVAGRQRGKYNKRASTSVRRRIYESAREGRDWQIVAINNGVKVDTARNWISKGTPTLKNTGGNRNQKITEDHRDSMVECLSETPELTLKELADKLHFTYEIDVCHQTISNHLDGMLFTRKRIHYAPVVMNSPENKLIRRNFVEALSLIMREENSHVVYIDETNLNLFTRREYGRSTEGKRVISTMPASKGPNIHIIGAISQNGLEYWEKRRGSYKKEEASNFVKRLIQTLVGNGILLANIVIICDNAPCHSNIESLLLDREFATARILRLGPYSPQINPIEAVWSFVKDKFKGLHAIRKGNMMAGNGQNDLTNNEYRLRYVENIIDDAMTTVTRNNCLSCFNHVQGLYPGVLAMMDLDCGV